MGGLCNSPNINKNIRTQNDIENFPNPEENFKYNNNKNNNYNLTAENYNKFKKNLTNQNIRKKHNSFDKKKTNNNNNNNNNNNKNKNNNKKKPILNNASIISNSNINILIHKKKNINSETNSISNHNINNENEFKEEGIKFTLEATLGEVEVPVFINERQPIEIIILNENEKWNFFSDEEPVSILGYENLKKYNNFNIGSLLYRISSSSKFKNVTLKGKKFFSESKGTLLLSANLDPKETDYEPKGEIHLKILGCEKFENNDFFHKIDALNGFNLNKLNNNEINNEKEIIIVRYVNMIRVNAKKFCEYYLFDLNEETKNFLNNFSSLHDLTLDLNLSKIAINLAEKIGNEGTTGHINSELKIEIQKYNNNIKNYGLNFLYGINNPLLIISRMIHDNYKNDLKNRNNILESKFTDIGVAIRKHLIYKWICVIIFVEK